MFIPVQHTTDSNTALGNFTIALKDSTRKLHCFDNFYFFRTCHLAGKLMRHIAKQEDLAEKGLEPSPEDILCVELAGLCHDLGRSHLMQKYTVLDLG